MPIARMYEESSEAVYQFIYFLVGEKELAQDLTQETFVKAMKMKASFRKDASEKTWLTKIARNLVYDHFTYVPGKWLESKDEQYRLYEALGKLPHHYREAIVLRKIEGFSIKESAMILGWNEAKIRNAKERGLKKIYELLGGDTDA